ncbi:MAM and LDL-receptor class A domain-containing protein 1-like [Pecten maximus]|uniref:MAM and LDL-receptor class A domain-containing protein 1-like n=1 Tax=Pecten maximus TaxID=6579 RepID=UPI001458EA00|nr:MAM and LDL-receptor class A domain-containing protein 1-like [Pecten maximus]
MSQQCSLSMYEICMPLSKGESTCVKECGIVPPPANGEVMYSFEFSVAGSQTPVTCNSGYHMLVTMTCLTSGVWTQYNCVPNVCTFETQCEALVKDITANRFFELSSGSTPSEETGCKEDHTTGSGSYYYFEASLPTRTGDLARMKSSFPVPAGHQVCVRLWYHMRGDEMGSLRIKTANSAGIFTSKQPIASGEQGPNWIETRKTVSAQSEEFWIVIEGERGLGSKSDICIDDVEIYGC